ncbi:putative nuclear transport factor 2 [Monocercomonoides exilis]|uniref:putative nuclear transport factor 2 n=1 Tax=Monocercomonoides exilis TaxID=2049356 RepID=UPI0035595827|nr:putative nuclear transport factor 2 [Monocercomonoides exilis]|eukprot:MONOS_3326.1-p1 / transcript=MONOS_3326.1 / gene=MONOS_3326 / organism=Monocercomonoides_exilis_PA203 / gene_product=nuclear transport factor 2 / transcript_product=nuclear transport factor 2 / location=Mono_scaffold00077:90282-90845(-) / protein_length=128 / sequence_SO=supercontig / SO=protein_coding / is_pseudo=false
MAATPQAASSSVQQLATETLQRYYTLLDTNREGLNTLYQPTSIMTMEGKEFVGAAILTQLKGLPQMKHTPKHFSIQPSPGPNCFHAMVIGEVQVAGTTASTLFAEYFHLVPNGTNFYVANQFFRTRIA